MQVSAIYVRISQARDGSTLGVERQVPPAVELAKAQGWHVPAIEQGLTVDAILESIRAGRTVEGIYVDNDLSAYSRRKPRLDYQRLLKDIRARHVGAVAAFDVDRITRDMREGEDLIELAPRTAFATGESHDLSTPGGRYAFRSEVARARRESEQKSARAKLKADQLARAGRYSGHRRAFGYDLDGVPMRVEQPDGTIATHLRAVKLVINPAEAAEIRHAAKMILDGRTISTVMADLNRRGIRRVEDGLWETRTVNALLTNPRIAGLRRWKSVLYKGNWEPILDRETWERVCLILENPAPDPRRGRHGPLPKTYLLTGGLGFCECGASVRAGGMSVGKRGYRCDSARGGCGRISRYAEPIEDFVRDAVLTAFGDPDRGGRLRRALKAMQAEDNTMQTLITERDAARAKVAQLEHEHVTDLIDDEAFARMYPLARARLAKVEHELEARPTPAGLPVEIPDNLEAGRAAWKHWTIDERRAVVAFAVRRVVLKYGARGRRGFEPRLLELDWRV